MRVKPSSSLVTEGQVWEWQGFGRGHYVVVKSDVALTYVTLLDLETGSTFLNDKHSFGTSSLWKRIA